jgi:hypothetical protein
VKHHFREPYLKRLQTFEQPNPAAYRFLKRIEVEGPALGLWLSTATGAHLYKGNAFLAYIQLSSSKSTPFSLMFSKHDMIWVDANDWSHLLLPRPLERLVMASSGFRKGWAAARNGTVELKANAPDAFYDVLLRTINAIEVQMPVQAEPPAATPVAASVTA